MGADLLSVWHCLFVQYPAKLTDPATTTPCKRICSANRQPSGPPGGGAGQGRQSRLLFLYTVFGTLLVELIDKLSILADAAKYDVSCASSGAP
ncbi:MAG TPA: hypothetical protein VK019_06310, partial [Pseudomonas sp.]|nr:hypothetical protein [Pseudomonas sp.]